MSVALRLLELCVKVEGGTRCTAEMQRASRATFRDRKRQLDAPGQQLPPRKERKPNHGHTVAVEEDGMVAAARVHPPSLLPSLSGVRPS